MRMIEETKEVAMSIEEFKEIALRYLIDANETIRNEDYQERMRQLEKEYTEAQDKMRELQKKMEMEAKNGY